MTLPCLAVAAALAVPFGEAGAAVAYDTAVALVEKHPRRDAGTHQAALAANFILNEASARGANVEIDRWIAQTPKGLRRFTNLYAKIRRDPGAGWIVLLSHYDTKPGCPGANDGASTSGLLVALFDAVRRETDFKKNIVFAWLDGEECMEKYGKDDGFWGSIRAAEKFASGGMEIDAAICLDMLGDRDLHMTLPRNSDARLRAIAIEAAKDAGLSDSVSGSRDLVKDDHVAFINAGVPALDIIDFSFGSAPGLNDYWHTPQDTPDKISKESLLKAGRFVLAILSRL